jgi:hypothetical protein
MAPAIVHFLVGASIVLLVAAPLAVRYGVVRRHGVALATVGGIWGLFPDIHNVTHVLTQIFVTSDGLPDSRPGE